MFQSIKMTTVTLIFICAVLSLFTTCKSPTNQESQDIPETVSYSEIKGEWEGKGYYNIEDNPWDADSIYITHLEVNFEKATVGDSVGYFELNNKVEYCHGNLYADQPVSKTNSYVMDIVEAQTETCGGGRGEFYVSSYTNRNDQKRIRLELNSSDEDPDEDPFYTAILHPK